MKLDVGEKGKFKTADLFKKKQQLAPSVIDGSNIIYC